MQSSTATTQHHSNSAWAPASCCALAVPPAVRALQRRGQHAAIPLHQGPVDDLPGAHAIDCCAPVHRRQDSTPPSCPAWRAHASTVHKLCMTNNTLTGVDNQWANGCGLGHGARQHPQRILGAVTGKPVTVDRQVTSPHTRFRRPCTIQAQHSNCSHQGPGYRRGNQHAVLPRQPCGMRCWHGAGSTAMQLHLAAPPPHSLLQNQFPQHHPTGSRTAGAPGASPAQATAAVRCFPATAWEQPNAV